LTGTIQGQAASGLALNVFSLPFKLVFIPPR